MRLASIDVRRRIHVTFLLFLAAIAATGGVHAQSALSNAAAVAAGDGHSCVLTSAGGVKCWGVNWSGQLGDEGSQARSVAGDVSGLTRGVLAIAVGGNHACALMESGDVKCWGANSEGQLGDGTQADRDRPVSVSGLGGSVVSIAAGFYHSCALTSVGTVKCWGEGSDGQLGEGSQFSTSPVEVSGLTDVVEITAGGKHNCARLESGGIKCWGHNGYGQLGRGDEQDSPAVVDVTGLEGSAAQVTAGNFHTCVRSEAGEVACWGWNHRGQLGDGTSSNRSVAVPVEGLAGPVALIEAGGAHSCALLSSGVLACWGLNETGQLGDRTTTHRSAPVEVDGLETGVATIGAGSEHTCVVSVGGGVSCWGNNNSGQLGDLVMGSIRTVPVTVENLSASASGIVLGGGHACALLRNGEVECWGQNYDGQVGDGSPQRATMDASQVLGLSDSAGAVTAGYKHSCALVDGAAMCWGGNSEGQLGDGTQESRSIATAVTGSGVDFRQLAAGSIHSCALTDAGDVKCWGDNSAGQLGTDESGWSSTPVDASVLSGKASFIAAGGLRTCAIVQGGGVQCWGRESYGALGDGSLTAGVSSLAAGVDHNCAVVNGGAKCWGSNILGQLGSGSGFSETPLDVPGLSSGVAGVAAGANHSCALTDRGEVLCWGDNLHGQLGDGSTESRAAPRAVVGLDSGVAAIAANGDQSCALLTTGAIKCWGDDSWGQLGDGASEFRPFPARVYELTAPGAPDIGAATAGNGFATVTFAAPANDGGREITSYTVTSSGDAKRAVCEGSPCQVNGLTNGTSYTFTVRATNDVGTGAASSPSNPVVPVAPQLIVMADVPDLAVGAIATLSATGGGSGNPVVFSSLTTSVCTVSGATLTALAEGECLIAANQAGSAAYLPAPEVTQSVPVTAAPPGGFLDAVDDFYVVASGRSTTIPASVGVLSNDLFEDRALGRALSESGGVPQHGAISLDEDGSFFYAPDPGFEGSDSFSYRACVGEACSTARVELSVQSELSAADQYLWLAPPASNEQQQGFIRLTNHGNSAGSVTVWGIDTTGRRSAGTITLTLGPKQSTHFNSNDLELGNATKGLTGALGTGEGNWLLVVRSSLDLDALAYIRTPDGFVTSMHDRVEGDGTDWVVPIFNPASNPNQVSRLRVINTSLAAVDVQITGIDDAGTVGDDTVTTTLPPLSSREYDASDLEDGNADKGLIGKLGDGEGKWRLTISATDRITVQSLLADPMGYLTNLSTFSTSTLGDDQVLWMVTPADETQQQGFLRLTNLSDRSGTVTLWGVDDRGQRSPGTATLSLGARATQHLNSQDLENGNASKGLIGSLGSGEGDWRILLSTGLDLLPLGLIRTPNGFVTTIHDVVAGTSRSWRVPIFNPGSNPNQVSVLRVVNPGSTTVNVSIVGTDDAGQTGPGGTASFTLAPQAAVEFTAQELEQGSVARGLVGSLGDGEGKWWLQVSADAEVKVVNMLRDPNGYLTNLSNETRGGADQLDP